MRLTLTLAFGCLLVAPANSIAAQATTPAPAGVTKMGSGTVQPNPKNRWNLTFAKDKKECDRKGGTFVADGCSMTNHYDDVMAVDPCCKVVGEGK